MWFVTQSPCFIVVTHTVRSCVWCSHTQNTSVQRVREWEESLMWHWARDCDVLATKTWWGDLRDGLLLTKTCSCPVFRPTQHVCLWRHLTSSISTTFWGLWCMKWFASGWLLLPYPFSSPPWVSISRILWLSVICCHLFFFVFVGLYFIF